MRWRPEAHLARRPAPLPASLVVPLAPQWIHHLADAAVNLADSAAATTLDRQLSSARFAEYLLQAV